MGIYTRVLATAALVAGVVVVVGPAQAAPPTTEGPVVVQADPFTMDAPGLAIGQIEMTTVSTRPTLVSGNEARVQVRGLEPDDRLTVIVNGRPASSFAPAASRPGQQPGIREGLVHGLAPGANTVVAVARDARFGSRTTTLTVVNHSIDGPIISGPHQAPFVCATKESGMGPPTDVNCDAPTQVSYFARNALGQFKPLGDPHAPLPTGTVTTTVNGRIVPFVVAVESAVINRSITRIAVLSDPTTGVTWNHDLLYQFGESCGTGFTQGQGTAANDPQGTFGQLQGVSTENIAGPFLDLTGHLGEGWMVAESTLTTFGISCNPATSAETLMMVKEHIADQYGDVFHTVGAGASGGALQQYLAANNYPGLLDAGTPLLSFPDILTTAMTVSDCILANHAFAAGPGSWTAAEQDAVTGEVDQSVCQDWQSSFGSDLNPQACPSGIPSSQVYDARKNPEGVRCDLEDDDVNLLGRDPGGHANLPLDNTGVQYGLEALMSGAISPAQFIALNRTIGGFDRDGNIVPQRNVISPTEAALIYATGEVTGRGSLADIPIIDESIPVGDEVPALDIHQQVWPYIMQARLAKAGDLRSQVIWSGLPLPSDVIDAANSWLDQIDLLEAAHPDWSRAQLVAAAQPQNSADQCRLGVAGIEGPCDNGVLRNSNPRQVAGEPLAMDNVDCRLEPVRSFSYPPSVTAADRTQLERIFPSGVCDYTAPPVGFATKTTPWLSYGRNRLANPPVAVGYPLVRSAVPSSSPGPIRSAVTPLSPTNPLTGPPSLAAGELTAVERTVSFLLNLLP